MSGTVGTAVAPSDFQPVPFDPAAPVPSIDYLSEPYIPRGVRVWVWGPTESGKSIWCLDTAARLSRQAERIVYLSQENPYAVEAGRVRRLGADPRFLSLYIDQGFDLSDPTHASRLKDLASEASLVVIDTLTQCWSGDENSNAEIVAFDRDVLTPLIRAGSSVVVVHHTGHGANGQPRRGASAGRGASAMGQKADVILRIDRSKGGASAMKVTNEKNRARGGARLGPAEFEVRDTEDGGLLVVQKTAEEAHVSKQVETERLIRGVLSNDPLTLAEIVDRLKTMIPVGRSTVSEALRTLKVARVVHQPSHGVWALTDTTPTDSLPTP